MSHTHAYPFVPICLCLCGGIQFGQIKGPIDLGLGAFLLGCLGLGYILRRKMIPAWTRTAYVLGLYGGFFLLGIFLLSLTQPDHRSLNALTCEEVWVMGKVVSAPREAYARQEMHIEVWAFSKDTAWQEISGKLLLQIREPQDFCQKGDTLLVQVWIDYVRSSSSSYLEYLQRQGIIFKGYARKSLRRISKKERPSWVATIRARMTRQLQGLIGQGEESAIHLAMVLGEKSFLAEPTREAFAIAGASHLLAVSGLHVGVIFLLLQGMMYPLRGFRGGRWIAHVLLLAMLTGYVFLTGVRPAVVRAVLMLGIMSSLNLGHFRFRLINVVALTAIIQLVADPQIYFDWGFQLSYLAVAGIIEGYPRFEAWASPRNLWLKMPFAALTVSLCATLSTAPLIAWHFGQFPVYFLLTSLATDLISVGVIWTGFLATLLAFVPGLNSVLALLSKYLIQVLLGICSWVSSLPYARLERLHVMEPGLWILLGQLILLIWLLWLSHRNKTGKEKSHPEFPAG